MITFAKIYARVRMNAYYTIMAVMAVMALIAYTPCMVMVLISAWIPAPPLESLPAMVNAVFIVLPPN